TVGELRIGSSESVAAGLLPAALERFSQQHPGIAETVLNDPSVVVAARQSKWAPAHRSRLPILPMKLGFHRRRRHLPGLSRRSFSPPRAWDCPGAPLPALSIHLRCRLPASGHFVTLLPASILRFGSYAEHIEGACGRNIQPATATGRGRHAQKPHPEPS